jgi:hypothetical protein
MHVVLGDGFEKGSKSFLTHMIIWYLFALKHKINKKSIVLKIRVEKENIESCSREKSMPFSKK